jgi:hypothetical protein
MDSPIKSRDVHLFPEFPGKTARQNMALAVMSLAVMGFPVISTEKSVQRVEEGYI